MVEDQLRSGNSPIGNCNPCSPLGSDKDQGQPTAATVDVGCKHEGAGDS